MDIDRIKLIKAARRSYREGLFKGTSGNLSIYEREEGTLLITPGSLDYEIMGEKDLVRISMSGEVIAGSRAPSSEWRMHAEIYKAFNDVFAIVHTHSPYATALAALRKPLPVTLIETAIFLKGEVRVADFALPGTKELGLKAAEALRDRGACLLANHGVVAVGKDLEEARLRAVYTEDAAKIYLLSLSAGVPVTLDGSGGD